MGDNSPFSFALEDDAMYENANIKVVGVGGAGNNAINNMVRNSLFGVNFIAVNTDQQALAENETATPPTAAAAPIRRGAEQPRATCG